MVIITVTAVILGAIHVTSLQKIKDDVVQYQAQVHKLEKPSLSRRADALYKAVAKTSGEYSRIIIIISVAGILLAALNIFVLSVALLKPIYQGLIVIKHAAENLPHDSNGKEIRQQVTRLVGYLEKGKIRDR